MKDFILAVITLPGSFPGEVECLEVLLEAGLQKLHIRKPGVTETEVLLGRLSGRWASRLVLHGIPELAVKYGIQQIHGHVRYKSEAGWNDKGERIAVSTSVHSWEEVHPLPDGLAYAFLSPVFDSISKPGYRATATLLQRPPGPYPCKVIGLGGITENNIGEMIRCGWEGVAVLGWIWEEPREAAERFSRLKKITDERE